MRNEIKLALIGIALAALLVGSRAALEHVRDQGRAEVQTLRDKDKFAHLGALQILTEQQRKIEQSFTTQLQKAQNEFTEKQTQIAADADRARIAANSLRNELATARARLPGTGTDSVGTITEYASTVSDLLERCTGRYRDVAGKADRHAADAEMMREAWPRVQTSDP